MNTFQVTAERKARSFAAATLVLTVLLMTAVANRMIEAPGCYFAGSLLIGPLAYFGAVFALLSCYPRRLPGWALRVVPLRVHQEFREFFGVFVRNG
jgi:hypothetical protein